MSKSSRRPTAPSKPHPLFAGSGSRNRRLPLGNAVSPAAGPHCRGGASSLIRLTPVHPANATGSRWNLGALNQWIARVSATLRPALISNTFADSQSAAWA